MLAVCALVMVLGVLLQMAMPEGFQLSTSEARSPRTTQMVTEIHSRGPIRLNEIMTANGGVLSDASGEAPDWVEIANVGSGAVNLKGYVLARNAKAGNVFVFPDMIVQPGECALVYADSRLQAETGEELHAPFRLSASGDVLMLFNQADVAIDTVNIPALPDNMVYRREDANGWAVSEEATPGVLNTEENYRALTTVMDGGDVQICEIMSSNSRFAPDENGVCHDYVLLRTASGSGADLSGWYLSDTMQLPRLWRFPEGTSIPAGGTLLVHCSGLNRLEDLMHLHTNFRLSSEGEQVILSNAAGQPVDRVEFDLIKKDSAYVRSGDGSWSIGEPTVP
ncbi:MAG: lamin tail domain-containing protein [Clostridia bacterium]|nr:lamin tail domain-containing protein [Clostridia bacterium]